MTYWNEINDTHLELYRTPGYQKARSIREDINDQGTVGDIITSSYVIFIGSCDIMTVVPDKNDHWARRLHNIRHKNSPLIALGVTSGGLPTIVRKMYAYINNFGAPKILYLTIPRFEGYEYVNKSGKCYNASSSVVTVEFALAQEIVTTEEANIWLHQLESNELNRNTYNNLYILEERFAFIETLCKLYNIKLHWSFNPSANSINALYAHLKAFENISDFMKDSFVGLPEIKDLMPDTSIGPNTHQKLYDKFMNPELWDYNNLCNQATYNYEWLQNK